MDDPAQLFSRVRLYPLSNPFLPFSLLPPQRRGGGKENLIPFFPGSKKKKKKEILLQLDGKSLSLLPPSPPPVRFCCEMSSIFPVRCMKTLPFFGKEMERSTAFSHIRMSVKLPNFCGPQIEGRTTRLLKTSFFSPLSFRLGEKLCALLKNCGETQVGEARN